MFVKKGFAQDCCPLLPSRPRLFVSACCSSHFFTNKKASLSGHLRTLSLWPPPPLSSSSSSLVLMLTRPHPHSLFSPSNYPPAVAAAQCSVSSTQACTQPVIDTRCPNNRRKIPSTVFTREGGSELASLPHHRSPIEPRKVSLFVLEDRNRIVAIDDEGKPICRNMRRLPLRSPRVLYMSFRIRELFEVTIGESKQRKERKKNTF